MYLVLTAFSLLASATMFYWDVIRKEFFRVWYSLATKDLKIETKLDESIELYKLPYPPGPRCLPVIGSLATLAKYDANPWYGFDKLREQYGNTVWLQLGQFNTVLISSLEAMREVLLNKADHFADRPHFHRHSLYFDMNRQNALALCDWSDAHKDRRSIAHAAVIPRLGTDSFKRLSQSIKNGIEHLMKNLNNRPKIDDMVKLEKCDIMEMAGAIFYEFLLEEPPYDNRFKNFKQIVYKFDWVFWDINQLHVSDFIPFLQNFSPIKKYYNQVADEANWVFGEVNKIIEARYKEVVKQHHPQETVKSETPEPEPDQSDEQNYDTIFVDRILLDKRNRSKAKFLDFILQHYLENQKILSWNQVIFEIGDLIGGHSAVGNLLYRLLGLFTLTPDAQDLVFESVHQLAQEKNPQKPMEVEFTIEDSHRLPLVTASVMESLRLTMSPIVPHLSRRNTSLQGYYVPKGTMILFNIYHLNLSDELYDEPFRFRPQRFINSEGGVVKPEHFFPFSYGRRSCLGYKMVYTILSATVANLLLRYKLIPLCQPEIIAEIIKPAGSLALPPDQGTCFSIGLKART